MRANPGKGCLGLRNGDARLARCADGQQLHWADAEELRAQSPPDLRRNGQAHFTTGRISIAGFTWSASGPRTPSNSAIFRRSLEAVLYLCPVSAIADHLQGDADRRIRSAIITPTWRSRILNRPWRSSIRDSAPTLSPAGTAPIRTAIWPTTARSTPCAATATGCGPATARCNREVFGDELQKMFPILTESGSDSATLDNALQFLTAQRPQPGPLAC